MILAREGYTKGTHYWEFTAWRVGKASWCGVCDRPPDSLNFCLGYRSGFAVPGHPDCAQHVACYWGDAYHSKVPCFADGDRVGFVLDCDAGALHYYRNSELQGVFDFKGKLREFRGRRLYPAFSNCVGWCEFTAIKFGW
eukprot:TRINITY_DN2513_c0_g1_i2.p1 TRINITY_DN2513_c0_g1~~TRINITY_DN2513_c0_g1_i2.p1  ORF type:complete len:139 (+),score=24.03 TRINITY_DN2513_c0_g1_i2:468-884(+)